MLLGVVLHRFTPFLKLGWYKYVSFEVTVKLKKSFFFSFSLFCSTCNRTLATQQYFFSKDARDYFTSVQVILSETQEQQEMRNFPGPLTRYCFVIFCAALLAKKCSPIMNVFKKNIVFSCKTNLKVFKILL